MTKRERNWKPSLLTMEDIEYDLRIGATKYYEWMVQGLMPHPHIKVGGVTRWLTKEVEDCLDRFPDRAALNTEMEQQTAKLAGTGKPRSAWSDQRAT